MDESYYDRQVRTLNDLERRVHEAATESATVEDMKLRATLGSPGSSIGKAIKRLQLLGLLEYAGKSPERGHAKQYRRPDLGNEEKAAKQFASTAAKGLTDVRVRREQGEWREWYQTRTQILRETAALTQLDGMTFWDAAPENEIDQVLYEVQELHAWAGEVIESIQHRQNDDKLQAKIDKILDNTTGRTLAELAVHERKAEILRAKMYALPTNGAAPAQQKRRGVAKFPTEGTKPRTILDLALAAGDDGIQVAELVEAGLLHQSASRRITDLHRDGWLMNSGRTRPGPSGTPQTVWVATDKAKSEAGVDAEQRTA